MKAGQATTREEGMMKTAGEAEEARQGPKVEEAEQAGKGRR